MQQARAKLVQLRLLGEIKGDIRTGPWRSCVVCGYPTRLYWACEPELDEGRDCYWTRGCGMNLQDKYPDGAPEIMLVP